MVANVAKHWRNAPTWTLLQGRTSSVFWRKKSLCMLEYVPKRVRSSLLQRHRSSGRMLPDGHRKNSNCLSERKKCSRYSVPGTTGSGWMRIVINPTRNNTPQKQWLCPSSTLSDLSKGLRRRMTFGPTPSTVACSSFPVTGRDHATCADEMVDSDRSLERYLWHGQRAERSVTQL